MNRFVSIVCLVALVGCDQKFEPDLTGWRASVVPARRIIQYNFNGREKRAALPGGPGITYRYAQWSRTSNEILLAQLATTDVCYDYRLLAVDTAGAIVDTIYTPPPGTSLNFKLAPNDSLMVLKTYQDNCVDGKDYKYTFYNRFTKKWLPDTIRTGSSRGILLPETIWSPDSRKVILTRRYARAATAFVYDLVSKDTVRIDKGTNFIWSPNDKELITYIKDYSLYERNIATGRTEIIYEGRSDHEVTAFRWDPAGKFMMIHVRAYFMNVEAPMFQNNFVLYLSMPEKKESERFHMEEKVDTWKYIEETRD